MTTYCKVTKCICQRCGRPRKQVVKCKPNTSTKVYGTSTSRSTTASHTSSTVSSQVQDASDYDISASEFRKSVYRGDMFNIAYPGRCENGEFRPLGVLRWVRRKHTCAAPEDIHSLVHAAETVQALVRRFVDRVPTGGWSVDISMPRVLRVDGDDEYHPKGYICVMEKYLPDFQKFTDVSGWAANPSVGAHALVQAFAHFVFVASGKQLLVTDLQGFVDTGRKTVVLSCPTVLSREGGEYGCRDIGVKGFNNFLNHHRCKSNPYCKHFVNG